MDTKARGARKGLAAALRVGDGLLPLEDRARGGRGPRAVDLLLVCRLLRVPLEALPEDLVLAE